MPAFPDRPPPSATGSSASGKSPTLEPDDVVEFVAQSAHPRSRTDVLVAALLAQAGHVATRADIQRWIKAGQVWVDGRPARQSKAVPSGAVVRVQIGRPPLSEAVADPTVPIDVVYEDADLLIVNKPAGLVVHPARGHWRGTLVNGLLARADFVAGNADPRDQHGHLRPGIVHRLDKDTSGLLVVAKNAATREGLKAIFATHDLERRYTAIVLGDAQNATYDTRFGRHPHSRLRFTSSLPANHPSTRRAITHVERVERLPGASVVHCRLETGRTHQIRVHLAERGRTPVLADELYGRTPDDAALASIAQQLGRQALHAGLLAFEHPRTGQLVRCQCPLPADMATALRALRSAGRRATTPSI